MEPPAPKANPMNLGPPKSAVSNPRMKPALQALKIPGDTEAARMDNVVKMLFRASKAEYVK